MRINAALISLTLACIALSAAAQPAAPTRQQEARYARIMRQTPMIDGHNDLPWAIRDDHQSRLEDIDLTRDTTTLTPPLHTDIPRLRRARLGAQFWSVYVPASFKGLNSTQAVFEQIDLTRRIIARYPRVFEFADSAADIVRIHRAGRIASMFGAEGGEAFNNNLALIREFRAAGVLYMTLTHSENTSWVDSATAAPQHGGLTPFGEEVVREMNRVGMLVDLSHVSAEAMRDALRVTTAPVIFSHSSAFAITGHPRNVPDDVLRLVHENGGVVMVNFNAPFVSEAHRQWSARRAAARTSFTTLNPAATTAQADAAVTTWEQANPQPAVTAGDVADHIEQIAQVAGHDNVGLGGDYDGVTFLPQGMGGVDGYRPLFFELMRRGWSDANLAKLAGGNLLRALRGAERVAARS